MRSDAKDLAQDTDPKFGRFAGMLRRMTVTVHAKPLWQVTGFRQPDDKQPETRQAEPFTGIGFFARPSSSGKPEAVVGFVGGDRNPIVIATRDEKTRVKAAGALQPNETAMFNDAVIAIARADGTFEVRSLAGVAGALAMLDELATLVSTLAGVPAGVGSGDAAIAALQAYVAAHPTWPAGTQKLKGE